MKHFYKSLTLILAVTLFAACVTERKKDEAKGFKLFMHNVTAKYNGYFNANVLVQDATDKLTEQHQDNYSQILDVYPYLAVDNPSAAAPDLDKAIEKVAVVATYHRPSHWVDDCYLMMGKAQFLKHDFESAEETFAYLAENYNPSMKKKINKKDKAKAVAEAREEKQKERAQKAKDTKKQRELAIKEKEKDKEEKAKQAEKDKKDREIALKNAKEEEAQKRKDAIKDKKLSLEERNELKRKENEARTEQRRKEREEKERLARQGVKTDKIPSVKEDKTPSVSTSQNDKNEASTASTDTKKGSKDAEKDGKLPKLDKPKAKPDNYFLKHRPCYQEGVVWYARTLVERQNYVDAEVLLDEIDKSPKTFKDIRVMSAIARADLNMKQKNYDAAITSLEKAISLSKKKKEKVRLAYILAQLYQHNGNSEKAYAAFDKVLKYNPVYEMEFNSRLNKSLNDTQAGEQTTASLIKMSKDFKNREYGDQIYFTLAQIALKKGDKPQAIAYLQQALASPGRGKSSKGEAFYMMANLQYEAESFVLAKNYFDSAATSLAKSDPRKIESDRYALNLMDIAKNIQTINLQDSLLKVANLTDKEKKELALRIKKDKLKAASALANPSVPGGAKASDFDLAEAAKKSKFWGYNAEQIKKSKREFEKKWGTDRKNEDNWRRINKRSNGDFSNNKDVEVVSSEMTAKEYQDIMKDVPKTPKDVETAQDKIEDAMYQLGTLYHDKLKNDKKTVLILENYLTRFPKTKQELEAWYYLYMAYTEVGNKVKAQDYYDKIIAKYPGTAYASMLRDKDKPKVVDDKENVYAYYSATYNLFKEGKYKEAQVRIKESDTKYGVSNALKPKFALLDAMCTGHELGRINYIASLKEVANKYVGTPEEKRAQEILRILEFGGPVTEAPKPGTDNIPAEDTEDPVKKFVPGDEKLHYVIIVLNKNADLEDAKVVVSEFDSKYNRTDALNVSSMFFSTESETPVVVVRKFRDKTIALKYTQGIAKNPQDFLKGVYEVFAISQDNYREVIRQKNIEAYRKFYEVNYK